MDATRFNALLRALTVSPSRRRLARFISGLRLGTAFGPLKDAELTFLRGEEGVEQWTASDSTVS